MVKHLKQYSTDVRKGVLKLSKNIPQVIDSFFRGDTGTTNNRSLSTDGVLLYSYQTVIGQKEDGMLYVNSSYYTRTTSIHLSTFLRAAQYQYPEDRIIRIEGHIPYGVTDLKGLLDE